MLPEPDFTVVIHENDPDPFQQIAQGVKEWLANHDAAEDILVGDKANAENIDDFEALQLLGPHPLLERQMKDVAPLRWLHIKLQLADNADDWLRFILRADNLYAKGFANQPNGLSLSCFEITEVAVHGEVSRCPPMFPAGYNAVALDWDLKYHQMLSCEKEDTVIVQMLRQLWDQPNFLVNAIKFWSSHDPTDESQKIVARRILAAIIFKLCEFLRMKMNFDTPRLMKKVWRWGDVCKDLRRWKERGYTNDNSTNHWRLRLTLIGIMGPRHALELVSLVLNKAAEARLCAEGTKTNVKGKLVLPENKGCGAPMSHDSKAAGSKDLCTEDQGVESYDYIPFGRCRIQILGIRANFPIDDIVVYDWHRGQTVYKKKITGCPGEEDGMKDLILCGPRRVIGAYGCFGIKIFPTESMAQPIAKRRKTAAGASVMSECLDVSDYDDIEPSTYMKVLRGSSDRRVELSYMLMPNTIEADIKVRLYLGETCHVSGFIKATATGYGTNYVELFRMENLMENQRTLCVQAGQWTAIPLLVHALCLPYCANFHLRLELDLELVAQDDGTSTGGVHALLFDTKYDKQLVKLGGKNEAEVIITMDPDPLAMDDD